MGGEGEARASTSLNLPGLEWFLARGTRTSSPQRQSSVYYLNKSPYAMQIMEVFRFAFSSTHDFQSEFISI